MTLLLGLTVAWSADRMHRLIGAEEGLPTDPVFAVDVDPHGRIWVGGPNGIALLDGSRVRRLHADAIPMRVESLAVCDGATWVIGWGQGLWRVTEDAAEPVRGEDGGPRRGAYDVTCDRERGAVWIDSGRVWRGDARGAVAIEPAKLRSEGARALRYVGGRLLVGTSTGVWEEHTDGAWSRLFDSGQVVDVWAEGDTTWALDWSARLLRHDAQGDRVVMNLPARGISLVGRKGTLWVGTDRHLAALAPDGSASVSSEPAVISGGPLAVGREGELLVGTFGGLYIFPEPDTRTFGTADGLPNPHARFVTTGRSGLWVTTWQGTARVRPPSGREAAGGLHLRGAIEPDEVRRRLAEVDVTLTPIEGAIVRTRPCEDGRGVIWAAGAVEERQEYVTHAIGWSDGGPFHWTRVEDPGEWVWACGVDRHGDAWFWSPRAAWQALPDRTLRRLPGEGSAAEVLSARLAPDGALTLVTSAGVCRVAPAERGASGGRSCISPSEGVTYDIAWMPDGTALLATAADGLLESYDGVTFHPVRDALGRDLFAGHELTQVTRSPRGGVWVAGAADRVRIDRVLGSWRVVERLEGWHGLPGAGATSILEVESGDVWATTWHGAIRVPASSREEISPLAEPFLSAIEVDGRAVSAADAIDGHRWRITLGAPSFRDPDRRRFRAQLDGGFTLPSASPVFDLVGLPPGQHRVGLQASLDGVSWATLPQRLTLAVPAAWYQRWDLYAALLSLGVAVFVLLHRERVRRAIALERQRLRIAMDLHDELGSGLGSVGILAGLAADDGVDPQSARGAAGDIADIAGALGDALSDIVWSLRPESNSTRALQARLREQARRLVPGPRPELVLELDLPDLTLDPAVCRAVHRVAIEAIYNAVRHARAGQITVRLHGRGRMTLEVRDDGVGLGPDSGGLGLRSMRRRADDIGASLVIGPGVDRGCAVVLRFGPNVTGGSP